MDETGKRVVVTGGASGIGRSVARRLLAGGARVAVLDLPRPDGATPPDLSDEQWVSVDVTSEESVASAVAVARERLGGIDALVSCAGVATPTPVRQRDGSLPELRAFRDVVAVNLIGLYDVLRHCVVAMAANEPDADGARGVVVNLSSIAAYDGQIGQSAYAASKGAVAALTLPLARELGRLGIRVLAICPGIVDTPMLGEMPETLRERLSTVAVFPRRAADPAELADFIAVCLRTPYLNGEVIRFDAGARLPAR